MPENVVHIESKKLYITIWFALLCFTALTTGVAYIDLGPFNTVVALVIAIFKASLVVFFFMHARHSERLVRVVIGCAVFWLLILISISMTDFATRKRMPGPQWFQSQPLILQHLQPGPTS